MVLPEIWSEKPRAKITGNTTRPPTNATEKSERQTTIAWEPTFSRRDR